MYALAATLDADAGLPLARAVFGEMALAGITLAGEFHYLHAGGNARNRLDQQVPDPIRSRPRG